MSDRTYIIKPAGAISGTIYYVVPSDDKYERMGEFFNEESALDFCAALNQARRSRLNQNSIGLFEPEIGA